MNDWISIEERVPTKITELYITYRPKCANRFQTSHLRGDGSFVHDPCRTHTTHWMLIPSTQDERWVSVKERLPKKSDFYVVLYADNTVSTEVFLLSMSKFTLGEEYGGITHWLELDPPGESNHD